MFHAAFPLVGILDLCNTNVNNNNVKNKFIVEYLQICSSICPLKGVTMITAPKPYLLYKRESVDFILDLFTTADFKVITRCV